MTKICITCGVQKDTFEFAWRSSGHEKRVGQCRECRNRTARKWRARNPKKSKQIRRRSFLQQKRDNLVRYTRSRRNARLKIDYGITIEQYEAMVAIQNNRCAICGQFETACSHGKVHDLSVDHDHETGKIRALLCSQCNHGIGQFSDDPIKLQKAVAYLKYYGK